MQGRTTAAQPVLSQRVERQAVSKGGYFSNLVVWCMGRIMRQEWVPVDANSEAAGKKSAFQAITHGNRISDQAVIIREEDSVIAANLKGSAGERYHGVQGRLLAFRKPK